MKICLINSFYYPNIVGGAEISIKKMAEGFVNNGDDVHIICTGDFIPKETINGVKVHRMRTRNIYQPLNIVKFKSNNRFLYKLNSFIERYNIFNYLILRKLLIDINPDIVHTNNLYGISPVIWYICKKRGVKVVHTLRDYSMLYERRGVKEYILNKIYGRITKNIDAVTAPSSFTLMKFCDNDYFKNSFKESIFNAVDINLVEIDEINYLKKNLLENNEILTFIYFGRLEEYKGILYLINAFRQMDNDKIQLIIAGEGSLSDKIEEIAKDDKRIKMVGFLNETELKKELSKANIGVIPSLWAEPFGRVVIESYKFSMPVIATKIGGLAEIVDDNYTGLLVEAGNEQQLKEAIEFFSCKDNIKRVIDNCAEKVNEFSIDKQIEEYSTLYKKIKCI